MRSSSIRLGLLLILAGIIVFLINLGYGSWGMVGQIWRLWPIIFIIIGVKMIWRGPSSEWFSFAIFFLLAIGIITLLFLNPRNGNELEKDHDQKEQFTISRTAYPSVSAGIAEIEFGGGSLTIGSNTTQWFQGNFQGFAARTSIHNLSPKEFAVQISQTGHFSGPWWRKPNFNQGALERSTDWDNDHTSNPNFNWDLQFSPALDWDITIRNGAAKGEADLSGIRVKNLKLKMGAGNFTLNLGNKINNTQVKIEAGASKVKVNVPKGSGVKVNLSGTLVHNNFDNLGWNQRARARDRSYLSPDYEKSTNRIELDVNMVVGDFEIAVLQ